MNPEPDSTTVEWGSGDDGGRDPFAVVFTPTQLRRYVAYPLAALGAAAAFGSLLLDWQSVRPVSDEDFILPSQGTGRFGIVGIFGWGSGWVLGAMVLVACTVLALFGEASARRHTRLIGLAAGGVLFGFLVAAAVSLSRSSLFSAGSPVEYEHGLEPGVPLAFGSVLLLGAALWLAPRAVAGAPVAPATEPGPVAGSGPADRAPGRWPPRRAADPPDPADSGPADLSVARTDPFTRDHDR